MTEICTICHNNIGRKNIVITECSHTFHFSCLLKNIKYNKSTGNRCPLCRTRFMEYGNFTIPNDVGLHIFNFCLYPGKFNPTGYLYFSYCNTN